MLQYLQHTMQYKPQAFHGWGFSLFCALALVVCCAAMPVHAQTTFTTGSADLGWGSERFSSPLVRVSPTGALVLLGGQSQLAGPVSRVAMSGTAGYTDDQSGLGVQLGGTYFEKRSDHASGLAFSLLSIDPMISLPLGGGSVTLGLSWQKIGVANAAFRERQVLHADWTEAHEGGYTSYVLEHGRNSHARDFDFMDGTVSQLLVRRQWSQPGLGLEEFAAEFGVSRDSNQRGNAFLDNTLWYVRASLEKALGEWRLGVSWMHQDARFAQAEFVGSPARRDQFDMVEATVSYPLSTAVVARLELTEGRNAANVSAYRSRIRGAMLSLGYSF